jgi:hemerythrin-like domain-containing protein
MKTTFPGAAAPAPGFDEPLEMLEACHGRIKAQLATLERLVVHSARHGSDQRAQEAARAVMRYFDTAGAHHHRDEEDDLFPLLRQHARQRERDDVLAVLAQLESDHRLMDAAYAALRKTLEKIAAGEPVPLERLQVDTVAQLYQGHIPREETLVFGFAKEVLDLRERETLGVRMAARRGVAR